MKTSVTTCYDEHGRLLKRVTTTDFGVSEYAVDKVDKALHITSIVAVVMMIVGIIGKIVIMFI